MVYKREGSRDSTVEGFWKKDKYAGRYEHPWKIHSKSGSVRSVDVEYYKDATKQVKIVIHTSVGQTVASNFIVLKGDYDRIISNSFSKTTESVLTMVNFPFHIKFNIGREEVEIEFFEPGNYTVNVNIN
jgi:hypothetical protein